MSSMFIAGLFASELSSSDSCFLFLSACTILLEFSLPEQPSGSFALPREGKLYLRDCNLVADIFRSKYTTQFICQLYNSAQRLVTILMDDHRSDSTEQMIHRKCIYSAGRQEVTELCVGVIKLEHVISKGNCLTSQTFQSARAHYSSCCRMRRDSGKKINAEWFVLNAITNTRYILILLE